MSMLSAAPWCRSASSSLCRQVAVMLVAADESCWHREAENEKFPSPTSKTVRGGDMCNANGPKKNRWSSIGGGEKHSLSRVSVTKSASLQPEVPREEASVGATVVTISPLEIWHDCRNDRHTFRLPPTAGSLRCVNEISSVVSPNPPTHCRADPLTFSCSPAALLRTQSVRLLHLWATVCHNYSSPTRNIYWRSAVSTPIHIPPNENCSKIHVGYLYYFFLQLYLRFTLLLKVKTEGFFFRSRYYRWSFRGEPCVMWRITSGVGSPLQHHFVPAPIIFYTLVVKCPNTHMTVYLAFDSFRRPGFWGLLAKTEVGRKRQKQQFSPVLRMLRSC